MRRALSSIVTAGALIVPESPTTATPAAGCVATARPQGTVATITRIAEAARREFGLGAVILRGSARGRGDPDVGHL